MNRHGHSNLEYFATLVLATICGFALAVSAALAQEAKGAKDLYGRVDQILQSKGANVSFEFYVPVGKDPKTKEDILKKRTFEGFEATVDGVRVAKTDSFILLTFADKVPDKKVKGKLIDVTMYMSDFGLDGLVDRTVQVALTADQISSDDDEAMEDDCASPEYTDSGPMKAELASFAMALGTSNSAIAGEFSDEEVMFYRREIRYVNHSNGMVLMLTCADDTKRFSTPKEVPTPGDAPVQQAKFEAKLKEFLGSAK